MCNLKLKPLWKWVPGTHVKEHTQQRSASGNTTALKGSITLQQFTGATVFLHKTNSYNSNQFQIQMYPCINEHHTKLTHFLQEQNDEPITPQLLAWILHLFVFSHLNHPTKPMAYIYIYTIKPWWLFILLTVMWHGSMTLHAVLFCLLEPTYLWEQFMVNKRWFLKF